MFRSSWSCLAVGLILGQTFAPALAQIFETTTTSSLSEQSTSDLDVEGHIAKLEVARDSNSTDDIVLHYEGIEPGETVKNGTELRILPVGDSITVGYLSEDGNGYRAQLQADLSGDDVVFAGTETMGTMSDGHFAAWTGKTIHYISDHVGPSLKQRPNIILLAAGTNDMNPNPSISEQGDDPSEAADRLGKLIDKMVKKCPDATILVAIIINTCRANQSRRTKEYQQLIPGIVKERYDDGHHVLPVDFTTFKTSDLQDCIHPTNEGYKIMGDWWYDFIHQIPSDWIEQPIGPDPDIDDSDSGSGSGVHDRIGLMCILCIVVLIAFVFNFTLFY